MADAKHGGIPPPPPIPGDVSIPGAPGPAVVSGADATSSNSSSQALVTVPDAPDTS
jgi:hypothetical protein